MLTHGDADHIGNFESLIDVYQVGALFINGVESDTNMYKSALQKAKQKNIPVQYATHGMNLATHTTSLKILFPNFRFHSESFEKCVLKKNSILMCAKNIQFDQNTNSIVSIIENQGAEFVLTGDAPVEVEKFVARDHQDKINVPKQNEEKSFSGIESYSTQNPISVKSENCTLGNVNTKRLRVLKLGHHGSKTSTSIELLELFKPTVSIVSSGLKNRYGHPHKSVIDRIQSNIPDSQICSTASGTISVRIKQKESF